MNRHPTIIAGELEKLRDLIPDQTALIQEAVSALYRQAATIAQAKAAFKD